MIDVEEPTTRRDLKVSSTGDSYGQMKCSIRSPCWLRSHGIGDGAVTGNEAMDFLQGVVMSGKNVDWEDCEAV